MKAHSNAIFILGLLPRSGTNFLSNLLQLHPDCAPADPVWEDFLVCHLDRLASYSDSVAGEWDETWGVNAGTAADLDVALGDGLVEFLEDRCPGTRVVSKTPRVNNLELFFRFIPHCKLLLLVRDGRSVVESAAQSFGWRRESAMHAVDEAANTINAFQQAHRSANERFRVLRYEDLWLDTENQLLRLFEFLGLDDENYDWEQALALPLRGSSELKTSQEEEVHWDPVPRPTDFDPMSRFAGWSKSRHARYNHVAGKAMEPFGYELTRATDPVLWFRLRNALLDLAWLAKRALRPVYLRWRDRD